MDKFTPGPWSWHGRELLSESDFVLCASDRPNAADARLIAAAPELLEALRSVPADADYLDRASHRAALERWWSAVASPAIAKATVEQ